MEKFIVHTNNSVVADFFMQREFPIEVKFLATPAIDVLSAAKTAASQGAVILSNPLSGVRTAQPLFDGFGKPPSDSTSKIRSINPYLSVLSVTSQGTVDFVSVKRIEEALTLYRKNARLRFVAHNDDTVKAFQASDLEALLGAMSALDKVWTNGT